MADMETGNPKHIIRERRAKLYAAAKSGDWSAVKDIFVKYPNTMKEKLNLRGETPLHVAVAAGQDKFVKELVEIMDPKDLEMRTVKRKPRMEGTESGDTAFSYAAMYGYEYGIRIMRKKNPELVSMKDGHGRLSVSTAALNGHQVIVYLLYYNTPQMEKVDLFHLVVNSIKGGLYGLAQRALTEHPFLATQIEDETQSERTILHALARSKISTESSKSLQQYQGLLSLMWDQITIEPGDDREQTLIEPGDDREQTLIEPGDDREQTLIDMLGEAICIAAEEGNVKFISMLLTDSYSDAFMLVNVNKHTAFHIAVLSRSLNIFILIHELGSIKDSIKEHVDVNHNNMLHLAGYLPSSSSPRWKMIEDQNGNRSFDGYPSLLNRLNGIPGAALQLQYELVWFQEVEKVMHPQQKEAKNKDKLSPRDLFFKEHEDLRKAGEEWMRNTATSCMVVATLIATVVFAAAFTVPGGNGQKEKDYGIPIFLDEPAFKVFVISDAISLVFSTSTVLSFLSILTSRYSIDDFRISLPSKLILGLLFLFISVIAMMIAFVAAFLVSFQHGKLGLAYPIAAISSIPIWLFVWQHARLFYQVIRSTFFSSLPFKTRKEKPSIWTRMRSQLRKIFARCHLIKFS